jgi:hypothetical protein
MSNYLLIIGIIPIIALYFNNMDFRTLIKDYANAPITRHLILDVLKDYSRPNDKISELIKAEQLISVKKGLYITGPKIDLPQPESFLIANHLRGPSYVSVESALSYWGLIPERTYEISSATLKTSKKYTTPVGRFSYKQLPLPYYALGIERVELVPQQFVLIASPEKALCDKIILTPKINLRSIVQTRAFLIEDLRMDEAALQKLAIEKIDSWLVDAPKRSSLQLLVNTLKEL